MTAYAEALQCAREIAEDSYSAPERKVVAAQIRNEMQMVVLSVEYVTDVDDALAAIERILALTDALAGAK